MNEHTIQKLLSSGSRGAPSVERQGLRMKVFSLPENPCPLRSCATSPGCPIIHVLRPFGNGISKFPPSAPHFAPVYLTSNVKKFRESNISPLIYDCCSEAKQRGQDAGRTKRVRTG